MSYSKQHYILHEIGIYTNTGQHGDLLHSESQAEGIYCDTNITLIGNHRQKQKQKNLAFFQCLKLNKNQMLECI